MSGLLHRPVDADDRMWALGSTGAACARCALRSVDRDDRMWVMGSTGAGRAGRDTRSVDPVDRRAGNQVHAPLTVPGR